MPDNTFLNDQHVAFHASIPYADNHFLHDAPVNDGGNQDNGDNAVKREIAQLCLANQLQITANLSFLSPVLFLGILFGETASNLSSPTGPGVIHQEL